ncbi:hypothetical protein BHF69_02360 [Anaerostipes sp. 992a]|uniref:hypothetical protein n=1 Tax=Anaerostipes sp. 992a TaxID=1261637 RepID=UPI000951F470|nr:hypothetical protein [Anaerostipes sp. 992a]OLR63695.1 hypothetical protein BHF69_02360 [Anaerostipes sp. 992a]
MNRKKALKATSEALAEFVIEHDAMIDYYIGKGAKMDLKADIERVQRVYPFVTDVFVRGDYALIKTVLPEIRLLAYRRYNEDGWYHLIIKIK